jgi:drug/metabolite transporter (DMT)-like permease
MNDATKGAVYLLVAVGIFAFMGIFVRFLGLPSILIVFFLFFVAAIVLGAYFLVFNRALFSAPNKFLALVLLCGVNLLNNFFFFQSFVYTTISNAVLSHYTAPLFVALFAPLLLKERIEKLTFVALGISFFGVCLLSFPGFSLESKDTIGIIYGILSAIFYAFVIISMKHLTKSLSPYTITFYMSLGISLTLLPFIALQLLSLEPVSYWLLLLFGVLFGVIATVLYVNGVKRLKSQHVGILAYLEPILAPLYAFVLLKEIPSPWTFAGGTFILCGGYLIVRRNLDLKKRRMPRVASFANGMLNWDIQSGRGRSLTGNPLHQLRGRRVSRRYPAEQGILLSLNKKSRRN